MKIIHILGAGRWQVPTIKMAKELDVKVLATDRDPDSVGFKFADFHEAVNITDSVKTLEVSNKYGIDGIMPLSCYGVKTAAYVAEALGLIGLGPDVAEISVDKGLIFGAFRKHGVPMPETANILYFEEAEEFAHEHGYPLYFKPVDNMGASRGIKRLDGPPDLKDGFDYAMSFSKIKRLILQKGVEGVEHNVESLTFKGDTSVLTMSDKIFPSGPKGYPYYNVESLNYPAYLSMIRQRKIDDAVKLAVGAVGVENGPTHIEVIHDVDTEYVIDFGARGGGGEIFSLITNQASGVNAVQESVRIFLGEEPVNLKPVTERGAIYYFFQSFKSGQVRSIKGVEEAKKIRGVVDLDINVTPGDVIHSLRHSTQRIGFAMVFADTRREAEAIIKKVKNTVKIEVESL